MNPLSRLLLASLPFLAVSLAHAEIKSLKIDGAKLLVNDKPARIWGVRVAAAAGRDEYTKDLLESLEHYKLKGVNAIVVYYQGATGQTFKAFAPDGKSFADSGIRQRMRDIINAANQKDMLVIVGLFFPRKMGNNSEDPRLESRQAYLDACATAAAELKDFRNIIISLAHDAGPSNWSAAPIKLTPADAIECLQSLASAAPAIPRGCGGSEHPFNAALAASDAATLILHTEPKPAPPAFPAPKPAVNICLFGRESGGRIPQGVWSSPERDRIYEAVDKYLASDKDHLIVHFQGWHEGGMDLQKNRFAVGGNGTPKDPGTAWFYEGLDRRLHPPIARDPSKRPTTGKTIFDY